MPWNGTIYTLDRGLSRLQKTMWSQIAPRPENIPPKGVGFSDFICIFAASSEFFACFIFATLRLVKILTWQDSEQQEVAQVLKKFKL